ncbi:PiggyBac transposable element-derived protein 4 [Eumeta japonica]|uniref:PiggyBac transposable element-derived protein 4 n=1 Tax=Eumeta variegata TaxID=151549 RepID=A0A4C1XIY2_EUMVA|nr:PiggyBac transposable element-derived protein 4 [Eumeta japonica]
MTSQRALRDEEIEQYLLENEVDSLRDSDSELENQLLKMMQSDTEDELVDEIVEPSDCPSDVSESNQSAASNTNVIPSMDARIVTPSQRTLRGKNKYCWATSKGQSRGRTSAINIVRTARGPTRMCKNLYDPVLCFNLFMTDEMVLEIVRWTNAEIYLKRNEKDGRERERTEKASKISATFRDTNETEIRAFTGVLTLSAAMKDDHLSTDELFDSSFSGTRYVAVTSRERFDFLVRCLRMDDKSLRPSLRTEDPFIPVRKVWSLLINQCVNNYIPGPHLTIDEQLLGFRGRCPFRMYIPNKPNKYGIKIPMMCDSGTKYMINAMPYIGKATNTNGLPQGEYYVKELSKPVHGTNRNITCDNWFTSVPLAKTLLQDPYKLTLVGTIRSNKREIPEQMKNTRSRAVGTSMFCYDGPLTLVSYKPKPSKMVYLLSSCDENGSINQATGKPEMIMYYNQTKGGVDTFDQMCSSMTCSRKTNRWPMAVFYGILNIAFVNSYVIYCHNVLSKNEKPLNRKEFMKKLSTQLTSDWMGKRLEAPTLKRYLRQNIKELLPENTENSNEEREEEEPLVKKKRYCAYCPSKIRRMSKMECALCKKAVCGNHKKDQLCYAHGLQLAVVDVLYKKRDEEAITPRTNESDTDDEDIDDDALDEQGDNNGDF